MKNVSALRNVDQLVEIREISVGKKSEFQGKSLDGGGIFGYNISVLGESLDPRLLGKI